VGTVRVGPLRLFLCAYWRSKPRNPPTLWRLVWLLVVIWWSTPRGVLEQIFLMRVRVIAARRAEGLGVDPYGKLHLRIERLIAERIGALDDFGHGSPLKEHPS
jgi:hypothetical protein